MPSGRQLVSDALDEWGVTDTDPGFARRGDVLLLATELLANAARASNDDIVLTIETHHDSICIAVTDDNPLPAMPRRTDDRSGSGRGLAIVEAVSDRWGQSEFDGSTKDVWGVVRIPTGSALATGCRTYVGA